MLKHALPKEFLQKSRNEIFPLMKLFQDIEIFGKVKNEKFPFSLRGLFWDLEIFRKIQNLISFFGLKMIGNI